LLSVDGEGQIELRGTRIELEHVEVEPIESECAHRCIWHVEQHLHQGSMTRVARRCEFFDEALERKVLMRIGIQRCVADAPEQLRKRRVAGQTRTHHERVHECSDQRLGLNSRAVRNGRSDGNVFFVAVTRQQHLERGQQRHERRRAQAGAEGLERSERRWRNRCGEV
jgi:hypothetical protein